MTNFSCMQRNPPISDVCPVSDQTDLTELKRNFHMKSNPESSNPIILIIEKHIIGAIHNIFYF